MQHKILFFALFFFMLIVSKVRANESEPNNSWNQANRLALNGSNNGDINPAGDVDWWKVTTNGDGALNLSLTSTDGRNIYFDLYDTLGTIALHTGTYTSTTTNYTVDGLAQGTYYIKIYCYYGTDTGRYTISNTFTPASVPNDVEPDSTRSTALRLPLGGSTTGHIGYYFDNHRDTTDEYKVTTNTDGALSVTLTSVNGNPVYATLYDNDGVTLLQQQYTGTTNTYTVDGLAAGTYYIKIFCYYSSQFAPYTLSDSLTVPKQANDPEPDSTRATALTLPLGGSTTGHIGYYYNHHRDTTDEYKVTTNADGALSVTLTSVNGNPVYAALYDNDGVTLLEQQYTSGTNTYTFDGLAAGTYYIEIFCYYSSQFAPYTLSDSLTVPKQANDPEPDSTRATALTLPLGGSTTGHIGYYYNHHRDTTDEYKVTTNADGALSVTLTSVNGNPVYAALYDNDGVTLLEQQYTSGTNTYIVDGLAAGTYYIKIFCYYSSQFTSYILKDSLYTYNANDVEPNKYASEARTLNTNLVNNGHIGFYYKNVRDTVDWFKINYTGSNGITSVALNVIPNITGGQSTTYMQVYKDTLATPLFSNYTTGTESASLTGLTEGYYYVKIFEYYSGQFTAYTVTPTFTQVDKARIVTASYDTAGSCTNNTITYKLSKSHAPYTVQLFRFGTPYNSPVTVNATKIVFDSLPDGVYNATAYGDGATGTAKGKSDTITIMPASPATSTTAIKSTQARLNWTVITCADYDSIQYRVHGTTSWSHVTTGNTGAFILKGLTPSTTYDWQVAAIDSSNKREAISAFTPITTFTTTATGFDIASTGDESGLSVGNSKLNNPLMISPNPASSYFIIHYNTAAKDKLIATLYDGNAKPVWTSGTLNADAINGKQVMVSQFESGLYYLKIINSQGAEVQATKVSIMR